MKISDEIRRWCKAGYDIDELRALADRIDSEMVELPKDADGVPIHVGDNVYLESGRKATVNRIELSHGEQSIHFSVCGNFFSLAPENLAHTRPDSWERIADDIDESKGTVFISENTLDGWADRIRRLADSKHSSYGSI